MKKRSVSRSTVFFALLALVLIGAGLVWGGRIYARFEQLALAHGDHEALLESMRAAAFHATVSGSMVALGIGILAVILLHMICRTARLQKEAQALRRKNEAVEALNRQTRQLAHHQRLETIGTLTAAIAHEFNNLLTPIMGYSMMALEKLPPEEEELYDDILEIYNASRKAKTIISRLSDLSRKNTDTTFHLVSPDEAVRRTLDVAAPARPKKVEVKLDLNCWDQRIRANEIQLSQLLLNLILNGFQAMGTGAGTLTVSTSYDERFVRIRVEDTGCGIRPEDLDKIFDPFFTTKESGKGTGLGLAIAAQVVDDHKGKIRVQTKLGQGTAFIVSLPRLAAGHEQ